MVDRRRRIRTADVLVVAAAIVIAAASCSTHTSRVAGSATPTATTHVSAIRSPEESASPVPPPSPLQIFGLGDSVPAADTCGCHGFLEQSADLLAPLIRRPVRLHNDAVDGWTTHSVVTALRSGAVRRDLAGGAGLVVIEAGANDLPLDRITDPRCQPVRTSPCFRPTLTAVGEALTTAVRQIRSIDPDHDPQIVLMGYWNVSVDGPNGRRRGPAYLKESNELTLELNQVVRRVVAQTGTLYVDAYTPLKGPDGGRDASPYLLPDGDHPNRAGHRLLAEALVERLKQTGAVAGWAARR